MTPATDFSLRPLERADASAVRQLWMHRFGGDPSTHDRWIEAALTSTHSASGIVALAPDHAVVGISFLEVGDRTYTRQYLGLETLDLDVSLAEANGLFHLSCVEAEWEGRGIGTAFYERRLEVVADRGVQRSFGIAWHRPTPPDSRILFEKHGFKQVATVKRYYARTGGRANCPVCSTDCTCTATLYGRSLEDS